MSRLNILNFSGSDSQSELVRKLNNNFEEIVGSYSGYETEKGITGGRGLIGARGPMGQTGHQGKRGSRWFLTDTSPTGPDINYGDYWFDYNGDSYKFTTSGWNYVENLSRNVNLFNIIEGVSGPAGVTSGSALVFNQESPSDYSMVFSDSEPDVAGNLNPLGAKFVISNDRFVNNSYILEFSKSNLDIPGSTGDPNEISRHPIFYWSGPSNGSDINLINPSSGIAILRNGNSQSYGLNFSASGNVNLSTLFSSGSTGAFLRSDGNIDMSAGRDVSFDSGASGNFYFYNTEGGFNGSQFLVGLGSSTIGPSKNINFSPNFSNTEGYFVGLKPNNTSRGVLFANSHYKANLISAGADLILDLKTQGNSMFKAENSGKIFTRLTAEKYVVLNNPPAFAADFAPPPSNFSEACNWYQIPDISKMNGRTIFLDTSTAAGNDNPLSFGYATDRTGYIGIGFDYLTLYGSVVNGTNLIYSGESIKFRVICKTPSSETGTTSLSGISLVGFWGFGTRPSNAISTEWRKLALASNPNAVTCWRVDFTFLFNRPYGFGGPSSVIAVGYPVRGLYPTRPIFMTTPV